MRFQLPKQSFIGAALGTMIEYYDYSLFIVFLPILAPLFFPADSAYQSLTKSYALFFISMLARPLGGIIFGYIGDHFGRRKALLASMYGIAFSTIAIGITPSFTQIGIWATISILLFKTMQGFCFGGEYNGAGIYVVEHAQSKLELFISSLLSSAVLFGSVIGTFVAVIATAKFSPSWGWRLAFILGGLMGILGIISRKNLLESPQFQPADKLKHDLKNMFRHYPKELIAGFFIGGLSTVPFTTVFTFLNPVLATKGFFSNHDLMMIQLLLSISAVIALISIAFFCHAIQPKKVMSFGCVMMILLSIPLLMSIDQHRLYFYIIFAILMIMANECVFGPSSAFLKNIFPAHFRYRASSFSFCLGMAFFGGTTPLIENFLYQKTNHFTAITLWLIFLNVSTFIVIKLLNTKSENKINELQPALEII
ncbi:MAG: major facilitator transporter [uncultured bacterium]|nr:MAG: major facilitator transporter [uncultured bacterium]